MKSRYGHCATEKEELLSNDLVYDLSVVDSAQSVLLCRAKLNPGAYSVRTRGLLSSSKVPKCAQNDP